ncbi:hypothetical protein ASZ78_002401, partial [Callipepla squamata]
GHGGREPYRGWPQLPEEASPAPGGAPGPQQQHPLRGGPHRPPLGADGRALRHQEPHPDPPGRPQPEDEGGLGAVRPLGAVLRAPRLRRHEPRQRPHAAQAAETRPLHPARAPRGPPQKLSPPRHRVRRLRLGQHQQPR